MMDEDVFYDTKSVPLSDRESFNNTILLLTMVKSQYYYIIGFSRPEETITIGFDFESKTEGVYTIEIVVDFKKSESDIIISGRITEVMTLSPDKLLIVFERCAHLYNNNGILCYERRIAKDLVFPSSVKSMNDHMLEIRKEMKRTLSLL